MCFKYLAIYTYIVFSIMIQYVGYFVLFLPHLITYKISSYLFLKPQAQLLFNFLKVTGRSDNLPKVFTRLLHSNCTYTQPWVPSRRYPDSLQPIPVLG